MTDGKERKSAVAASGSGDRLEKVPLAARLMLRGSLTARRAAMIIAAFTVLITVVGGILERVVDHREYPTIGKGMWLVLQTVTTVGYGDVTPKQTNGRVIATIVMLAGSGFLAVITAAVTASLVEGQRRQFAAQADTDVTLRLEEVTERLARDRRETRPMASGETSRWHQLRRPARPSRSEARRGARRAG